MFTGIIKKVSNVADVSQKNGSLFIWVKKPKGWNIWLGESISINGVCSTVKKVNMTDFLVEYMPETIKKTTAGFFRKGSLVNLEKSLKLSELLDGHLVQGHVDTTGKLESMKKTGQSVVMKIKISEKFMPLIADKGSVAIDGISLTVVSSGADWFTVSLVDYTLANTNLGNIKIGERVNVETDVLAKYLDKLLRSQKNAKRKKA